MQLGKRAKMKTNWQKSVQMGVIFLLISGLSNPTDSHGFHTNTDYPNFAQ